MEESKLEMTSGGLGASAEDTFREISWRDTMNYAAATGDNNRVYFDDTRPGGIIAPPMYSVAFTWPVVTGQRVQMPAESKLPMGIGLRGVHATQYTIFHRLIKPGYKLKAELKIVSIQQTRAGVLQTRRVVAKDDSGNKIFTEYSGSMLRGVTCIDGGGFVDDVPEAPEFEEESRNIWTVAVPVAREAAHVYDGCTDIINPIHTSRAVAVGVDLPDIILQGTCTLALAARELVNKEAGADPGKLKQLACQFSKMVVPGTTIQIQLIHRQQSANGSTELGFQVFNSDGEIAVSKGYAKIG